MSKRLYRDGFVIDNIVEMSLKPFEMEILRWFLGLISNCKSSNDNNSVCTKEQLPLQRDKVTHIWYVEKDHTKYYLLQYDALMQDFRNYYTTRQQTFRNAFLALCGVDKNRLYPLSKHTQYTRFGKKTFYAINTSVIEYLEGTGNAPEEVQPPILEEEMDMDLLDDKEKLSKEFLSFYHEACKVFPFTHRLPKEDEEPSKLLLDCQKYYHDILTGEFFYKNKFENKELPAVMDRTGITQESVLHTLSKWVEYMQKKNMDKLSLAQFFYNPAKNYSYYVSVYVYICKKIFEVPSTALPLPKGFQTVWDELVRRSDYENIKKDIEVKNAFILLYTELEKSRKKYDYAYTWQFLDHVFYPSLIEWLATKTKLTKYHFHLPSDSCTYFREHYIKENGWSLEISDAKHLKNKELYEYLKKQNDQTRSHKEEFLRGVKEEILNGNIEGTIGEDPEEEQREKDYSRKMDMMIDIELALDDGTWEYRHMGDTLEQIEKEWKRICPEKVDIPCRV